VAAAAEGQAGLAGGPVRVRMGIHTGEPLSTDDDYVGIDVDRAARIAAAGHLVGTRFELGDLGPHRLRDLAEPEHLYRLGAGDFRLS
jgi:class 3 adenylate cyclase